MAGAMLAGWMAAGFDPSRFSILSPNFDRPPEGVALYRTPGEVPGHHDAVLLGFKPHHLAPLGPEMQGLAGAGVAVHSLLAGLTLDQVKAAFPGAAAHVRVMPNLASRVNKSPVILAQTGLNSDQCDQIQVFYDALGTAVWLDNEENYDLLTALAGSGPGFVYRFIDALAEAARRLGADPQQAIQLAKATVDGASTLAVGVDLSPDELANRVASPGGMTREGLNILDENEALVKLLTRTLDATAKQGTALSQQNS